MTISYIKIYRFTMINNLTSSNLSGDRLHQLQGVFLGCPFTQVIQRKKQEKKVILSDFIKGGTVISTILAYTEFLIPSGQRLHMLSFVSQTE